jgi:hypothetical protein
MTMSDDQLTLFGRPIDRRTLLTLTGKVLAGSAVAGMWLSPELAQFVLDFGSLTAQHKEGPDPR